MLLDAMIGTHVHLTFKEHGSYIRMMLKYKNNGSAW